MAIGDIWRASVVGFIGSQLQVQVFHVKMKSTADPTATIPTYLETYLYSLFKTKFSNQAGWSQVNLRQLTVPTTAYDVPFAVTQQGSVASTQLATTPSVVVAWKTGLAGRSFRGRNYFAGLAPANMATGEVEGTCRSALQGYVDDIIAAVGAEGANTDMEFGVYSHHLGDIIGAGGQITGYDLTKFYPWVSGIVRTVLGSQRRREIGVGA